MAEQTLTARIADAIRRDIASGAAPPGSTLPSEEGLVAQFKTSRGTVRRALAVLVNEGLVGSRAGRGYYVRQFERLDWRPGKFEHLLHRRDGPEAGADAWAAEVLAQGRQPSQEVDVSTARPPAAVADRLKLDTESDIVVVRKRLRYVDEVPYQIADSYYPQDVAEGTAIMIPGDVTVPGGLMSAAGHRQSRYFDEIFVRMPSPEEAFRLDLTAGTPVAEYVRTGFNGAGRPVRVIITISPGDRYRIIMEFDAE